MGSVRACRRMDDDAMQKEACCTRQASFGHYRRAPVEGQEQRCSMVLMMHLLSTYGPLNLICSISAWK